MKFWSRRVGVVKYLCWVESGLGGVGFNWAESRLSSFVVRRSFEDERSWEPLRAPLGSLPWLRPTWQPAIYGNLESI